eukprot:6828268-Lingulodinium_polyedra.AAC.1
MRGDAKPFPPRARHFLARVAAAHLCGDALREQFPTSSTAAARKQRQSSINKSSTQAAYWS